VLLAIPGMRVVLLFASTAYLLYLAAKIAFSGSKIAFIHSERAPGFFDALALQAINPKAYVVHTTLMTGFPFMPENITAEIIIKFIIMNLIWTPIHFLWLWAGVALNRLDLSPRVHRAINIAMALAMLSVVGLAIIFSS
jgi:threonine/homoserine/homoserine lactone efflux protein